MDYCVRQMSDYGQRMGREQVDAVRRFNRAVTQRIGALDDEYLSRARSLGLSRLLWEVEPSGSEVRVLRYLPSNLPAPDIASELFVSVNTIRTHIRSILRKLGVSTRSQAVRRAWDLNLI